MGRVKKSGAVTPAGRPSTRRVAPKKTAARKTRSPGARGGSARGKMANGRRKPPTRTPAAEPEVRYRVRELDPREKCGPATSVQQLFRVDESVDGAFRAHLVFLDRHGWYCEHGRNCPAVVHARRMGEGSTTQVGRTQNGRMRA